MMPNSGPQLNRPGAMFRELEATPVSPANGAIDAIDAIARCRVAVLDRANTLVEHAGTPSPDDTAGVVSSLYALLMTSLETLKLAELHLRDTTDSFTESSTSADTRARHYQMLFEHAPAPALITDVYATIQEANLAAGRLFRRDPVKFERTALSDLLPSASREEFRRQFARFSPSDGVRSWRLPIARVGDVPLEVSATVQFVPDIGPTGSGLLYWMFARES